MIALKYARLGKHAKGFSLLEILISGAIMSSGLTGLAVMLFTAVAGTAQSGYRTTASQLADSMESMIEVSPSTRQIFLADVPDVVSICGQYNPCSAQQFSQANFKNWHGKVSVQLPGGVGSICKDSSPFDGTLDNNGCDGNGLLVIKIFWSRGAKLGGSESRLVRVTAE
jgi:type IV pilus assembly protein PilV